MNPMENNYNTKATSNLPRRAKRKKKGLRVNAAQVAENPSEFSFAIAKIAVAQICQSVGFKISQDNALEVLTNVSTRYMETVVRSAASFAHASNRTDSNIFDLINGIHDACSVQGFPGGSMIHKSSLLGSSALKEIMNFVNLSNKVSFAKPIPFRNVSEVTIDSGTSMCLSKQAKTHIPRWLPHFPKENCNGIVKERKCGEKLWEHSLAGEENCGLLQTYGIDGKEEKDAKMELPKGRERMKFKIRGEKEKDVVLLGVNMMNGVCNGRKRVFWNHDNISDCMVEENEDEKKIA